MLLYPADILLPKDREAAKMTAWATVACDQHTSEPEYWERVARTVGDAPSTLRLMLPEVYLGKREGEAERIHAEMNKLLGSDFFECLPASGIYVERTQPDGRVRRGLVCCVDLEDYDYRPGAVSPLRATEKTVVSRIPPRLEIRRGAPLDMPHILMLVDDPDDLILSRFAGRPADAYSFPLMEGGGYITGAFVSADEIREADASLALTAKEGQPLLAVGDGNHSLASAKAAYEELKKTDPDAGSSPVRYALCEIVNIYDKALDFEPIYRLVRARDTAEFLRGFVGFAAGLRDGSGESAHEFGPQLFRAVAGAERFSVCVPDAPFSLPVATLQDFLDRRGEELGILDVDYIHGERELEALASKPGCVGFLFGGMKKEELFTAVAKDGCLPRKTFSMGTAADKRYYIECRKLF